MPQSSHMNHMVTFWFSFHGLTFQNRRHSITQLDEALILTRQGWTQQGSSTSRKNCQEISKTQGSVNQATVLHCCVKAKTFFKLHILSEICNSTLSLNEKAGKREKKKKVLSSKFSIGVTLSDFLQTFVPVGQICLWNVLSFGSLTRIYFSYIYCLQLHCAYYLMTLL